MKVLFLDIDGVLNSGQAAVCENIKGIYDYEGLNRIGIGLLRKLCKFTSAKIVISSTWRMSGSVDLIAGALEAKGWRGISFYHTIIGATPVLDGCRGDEIQQWLNEHPEITEYVILDDDSDMLDSQMNNFVKVDSILGFTLYDMVKAMDILGVSNNPNKSKDADDLRNMVQRKLDKRAEDNHGYSL